MMVSGNHQIGVFAKWAIQVIDYRYWCTVIVLKLKLLSRAEFFYQGAEKQWIGNVDLPYCTNKYNHTQLLLNLFTKIKLTTLQDRLFCDLTTVSKQISISHKKFSLNCFPAWGDFCWGKTGKMYWGISVPSFISTLLSSCLALCIFYM